MRSQRTAFSLVEMVIVITIVGALSAIAIPRFSQSFINHHVNLAANRVILDLELAQSYARHTSQNITVEFAVGADEIKIPLIASLDNQVSYKTLFAQEPYAADLLNASFGGDRFVTFNGYGKPDSGGSVQVQVGAITQTVVLDAHSGKGAVE